MSETLKALYSYKVGVNEWSLLKTREFYVAGVTGDDITWNQKFTLSWALEDMLHAEIKMIEDDLNAGLIENKDCIIFLNGALCYIKEEIYNLKFKTN